MFTVHNETVCAQVTHGDDDTGRVVATLQCYCEDVPAWVSGEAFLSPSATILLAILAVVLYSFRQLGPLLFKVLEKLCERVFGAVKVDAKVAELANIFAAFEQLAPQVKDSFQFQLRHKLARKSAARERLTNFYKAYDAGKVSQVDTLLEKYAGKEEALFKLLVKTYGPEPGSSDGRAASKKGGGVAAGGGGGEAENKMNKEGAEERSKNVVIAFACRFLEMPSMVVNLEE